VAEERIWTRNGGVYLGYGVTPTQPPKSKSILEEEWAVAQDKVHCYPNPSEPKNHGDRHLLTIGPNGSGKTRRLLIPNLFRLTDWSAVVIDIKGELAALTAAYRARQPDHNLVVIDPFGVLPKNYPRLFEKHPFLASSGFNPLSLLDWKSDDFPDEAMALAEAIITVEGDEPYWAQSAQDLVAALIMYVRIAEPETGSLRDVRKLLGRSANVFRETIPLMQEIADAAKCPELRLKLERFSLLTADNKELNGIISTALTQTRWIDSRPISDDLEKGKFDFGSLKKRKTTVYLILPPRYLATHAAWLRVLITSALMPMLRSVDDAEVPVLLMLDEFAARGRVDMIEKNVALMRGYGVKLWVVLQDLAQIKTLYKDRWESFIGNAGVVQSFAPQDMTTRDYLSRLSGQRLYWLTTGGTTDSTNLGPQSSRNVGSSENTQYLQGPVYWQQGLGALDVGQAVLFARGRNFRSWLPDPEDEGDLLGIRAALRQTRADVLS
jgi:type IV secretion system protein VirD4